MFYNYFVMRRLSFDIVSLGNIFSSVFGWRVLGGWVRGGVGEIEGILIGVIVVG